MEAKDKNLADLESERDELLKKVATIPSEKQMKTELMELTHRYNDVKDAAQEIIGALAHIKGVTYKSIHEELNLPTK